MRMVPVLVLGTGALDAGEEAGQSKVGRTEGALNLWIGSPKPIQQRRSSVVLLPCGPQLEDQLQAVVGRPPRSDRVDVLAQITFVGLDIDAQEHRNRRTPRHAKDIIALAAEALTVPRRRCVVSVHVAAFNLGVHDPPVPRDTNYPITHVPNYPIHDRRGCRLLCVRPYGRFGRHLGAGATPLRNLIVAAIASVIALLGCGSPTAAAQTTVRAGSVRVTVR